MNIENKKTLCRFAIYLLFWAIVALAAYFSMPSFSGYGGGSGRGRGAGTNMQAAGGGDKKGTGSGAHAPGSGSGSSAEQSKDKGGGPPTPPAAAPQKTPDPKKKSVQGLPKPKNPAPPKPVPAKAATARRRPDRAPSINLPQAPPKKEQAAVQAPGPGDGGALAGEGEGFFGVKVQGSDRILFLLDFSGSMMTTTPDGTKTRCDLLRSEMEKCIKEGYRDACLEEKDGKFLIVCFSSQCTFFPRDRSVCRFSSEKDVADAGYFINNMPVGGGTSMMLAWNSIVPLISSHEIQTVCFLSDGEPTDCNEQSLLSFLKQKVPNLRIHTFSMGGASSLLKNAAAQHKGIYREIF